MRFGAFILSQKGNSLRRLEKKSETQFEIWGGGGLVLPFYSVEMWIPTITFIILWLILSLLICLLSSKLFSVHGFVCSDKSELILKNHFLTILFPVDRFGEMGPCSRTFFSDTGFTCLRVLGHIYAFYQVLRCFPAIYIYLYSILIMSKSSWSASKLSNIPLNLFLRKMSRWGIWTHNILREIRGSYPH